MKKIILLFMTFSTFINSGIAQDLILTETGKLLIVEIVRMDSRTTFYKNPGEKEMLAISNDKIIFFNWNARNSFSTSFEAYDYKFRIVTMDMSGNWVVLEKLNGQIAKNISKLTGLAAGGLSLFSLKASSAGESIGLMLLALVSLGVSTISGLVHIVMKHNISGNYRIKEVNNPFAIIKDPVLENNKNASFYFGAVSNGIGLQMIF